MVGHTGASKLVQSEKHSNLISLQSALKDGTGYTHSYREAPSSFSLFLAGMRVGTQPHKAFPF